jgi:hypothetical protein
MMMWAHMIAILQKVMRWPDKASKVNLNTIVDKGVIIIVAQIYCMSIFLALPLLAQASTTVFTPHKVASITLIKLMPVNKPNTPPNEYYFLLVKNCIIFYIKSK